MSYKICNKYVQPQYLHVFLNILIEFINPQGGFKWSPSSNQVSRIICWQTTLSFKRMFISCIGPEDKSEATSGTEPAQFVLIRPDVVRTEHDWNLKWCLCLNTVTTSQTWRNIKKRTPSIRILSWSWVRIFYFYPAHMYRGSCLDPHSHHAGAETSDSKQEISGCSSRY